MNRSAFEDAMELEADEIMPCASPLAESEFEKYRIIQDRLYESDFDRFVSLEENIKND